MVSEKTSLIYIIREVARREHMQRSYYIFVGPSQGWFIFNEEWNKEMRDARDQ